MEWMGYTDAAIPLVEGAGTLRDDGVLPLDGPSDVDGLIRRAGASDSGSVRRSSKRWKPISRSVVDDELCETCANAPAEAAG
jgi:hypothetical protein